MNLHDPWGAISSRVDPTTGSPYKITLTGDINGWASDDQGSVEFPVDPVTGEPGHYRTPILLYKAGVMGYKYRMPGLGNWDNWNAMNPHDQHYMIPASDTLFQANNDAADNIGTPTHNGGPLSVTFILKDLDDISKGRPVYITGDMWGGWSDDPTVAQPMELQPGLPHTYKATFDLPAPYGIGNTTQYKYIIKPDTGGTLWDDLNPFGNRWVLFSGTGTPATQTILDIAGGNRMMRILRTAAGLDPAPGWYGDYTDQDADLSGSVTVMDALKATRP
jgi:hypothetical protein